MTFITLATIKDAPNIILKSSARRSLLDRLAVDRGSWPTMRSAARMALSFAPSVGSAHELFGSWQVHLISPPLPEGFVPCNPSVALLNGALVCNVRAVNYRTVNGQLVFGTSDNFHISRNFLSYLDPDTLEIKQVVEVVAPPGLDAAEYRGLEDIRLIPFDGALWASFTVLDRHPSGTCQMAVARLSEHGEIERISVQDFEGYLNQKNWMPFVDEDGIGWITRCDPVLALRYDFAEEQALEWRRWRPSLALEHQRGSSQLMPWGRGWLAVTHEMHHRFKRCYLHRFVEFDEKMAIVAITPPFYFDSLGVEFCAGLCPSSKAGELLVSFGIKDCQAAIGRVSAEAIRNALQPCPAGTELPPPRRRMLCR